MDCTINQVLAAVNTANANLNLTLAETQFSVPRINDATWQGETLAGNTLIRATPNGTSKYTGTVVFGYDRLNLSVLSTLLGGIVRLPAGVTKVSEAVPAISAGYSILMHTDDFEDLPIIDNGDGTKSITLTAKSTAIGWVGSATFLIKAAPLAINTVITQTVLDGYKYLHDSAKGFAESYSYPYDFTAQFATLSLVNSQTTDFTGIAAALTAITGDSWAVSGAVPFSLGGATILDVGINQAGWPTNQNYKYAIVIQLGAACGNLEGSLIIHFNDPVETFDPSVV